MSLSLYRCKTEEIILHGEISGIVTDTTTSQPLQAAVIKLNPVNDTTSTGIDGKYLFKSLIPGDYDIEVSKPPYATGVRSASVTSANITGIDFALHQIPYPEVSPRHLDFSSDSTQKSFTITNTGIGILDYSITTTSQDWITVNPNIGEITNEPQTINVTIDRTGLSEKKYVEWVEIVFHVGRDLVQDTVYVCLNGVMDQDYNYYNIVTIGTQTWMAENLNTGKIIFKNATKPADNDEIEKYCYDDNKVNCAIYGGLYSWPEMMDYNNPDTKPIGSTQGICPTGWHVPTNTEWQILEDFLGGAPRAGGKMKETGFVHWNEPNTLATNVSGFTGLGGGFLGFSTDPSIINYRRLKELALFWTSEILFYNGIEFPYYSLLVYNNETGGLYLAPGDPIDLIYCSVRCIKDSSINK